MDPGRPPGPAGGVNLAGYLRSATGVGQIARELWAALEHVGIPVAPIALDADRAELAEPPRGLVRPEDARFAVSLVCVNPDGLEGALAALGPEFTADRHTIGVWWWETAELPLGWRRSFDRLDELWVGSRFVADAVAAESPVPVVRIPAPVSVRTGGRAPELPSGFRFLCLFDHGSVLARKNPLGTIEAFRRAFPGPGEATLVVKSVGAGEHPEEHAKVQAAAAATSGVELLDELLEPADKDALMGACDCVVSLHRAEGFGVPLAEALLLERPVIATAYGGPLDFLTPFNSYLVDFERQPIGAGNEPYPADGEWAEPDLDDAAAAMRSVFAERDDARERARRGRRDLERAHSPAAAGAAMAARLRRLARIPADREGSVDALELAELRRRMQASPPQAAPGASLPRVRSAARAAVLRATEVRAARQRLVEEELMRVLRSLDERVQGLAAAQGALQGQIDELERRGRQR